MLRSALSCVMLMLAVSFAEGQTTPTKAVSPRSSATRFESSPATRELTEDQKAAAAAVGTGTLICIGVVVILSLILTFMPIFIAFSRNHPNAAAITAVTLLLGWTFIGWVVALVWSLTAVDRDRRYR